MVENPEKEGPSQPREAVVAEIVSRLREQNPGIRLFEINIPDRPDEVFIARKASWSEFKRMLGTAKSESEANELLVQKFLVCPAVSYEDFQTQWDPGLVVTLATQITKGLGFSQGASIKNL